MKDVAAKLLREVLHDVVPAVEEPQDPCRLDGVRYSCIVASWRRGPLLLYPTLSVAGCASLIKEAKDASDRTHSPRVKESPT